jgi:hypothetical protein
VAESRRSSWPLLSSVSRPAPLGPLQFNKAWRKTRVNAGCPGRIPHDFRRTAVRNLVRAGVPERIISQVLLSSHSPFVICEAWNGEDRDFIHQVKVVDGRARMRKFSEVVGEQNIQLRKDDVGKRTLLGLVNAEEIMAGYLS